MLFDKQKRFPLIAKARSAEKLMSGYLNSVINKGEEGEKILQDVFGEHWKVVHDQFMQWTYDDKETTLPHETEDGSPNDAFSRKEYAEAWLACYSKYAQYINESVPEYGPDFKRLFTELVKALAALVDSF